MGWENFCPELPKGGAEEAQELIERFKKDMLTSIKDEAESIIGELYSDVMPFIESDSWKNYRNKMMDAMKNYQRLKEHFPDDCVAIRKAILEENREEITKDLNQDLVKEIERLKDILEQSYRRY